MIISEKNRKRIYRLRTAVTVLLLLTLTATTVLGIYSYVFKTTDAVTNQMNEAKSPSLTIEEEFDGTVKKNVKIKLSDNSGEKGEYLVRAAVIITMLDGDGNTVAALPEENIDYTVEMGDGWSYKEGYWYYGDTLLPGESTGNLINRCTSLNRDYRLSVDILAQSILSTPSSAVNEAWGYNPKRGTIMRILNLSLTMLMALLTVIFMSYNVFGMEGNVKYTEGADKFIFSPGSDSSATDLFPEFKKVMPGDCLEEKIKIVNEVKNNTKIKVYLRSTTEKGSSEFLNEMKLTVKQENSTELFKASVGETAQLTDWVYIGTVYSGGDITLSLRLDVPVEMGDEFQDEIGFVDWEFKVEELPVSDDDPTAPQTGKGKSTVLGIMLSTGLLALVILGITVRRRQNREYN